VEHLARHASPALGSFVKAAKRARPGRYGAAYGSVDLVVVDDIGMLPAGQEAAEAFDRVVDAAYERRSVAVISNIHPPKAHMFI
jgi:DNA replication protein DnaC